MVYDLGISNDTEKPENFDLSKKDWEELVYLATEQAKFHTQAHIYNEVCWDICAVKPSNKLDNKTSACLSNCVDRFIDVTFYITNRYFSKLQRSAGRL